MEANRAAAEDHYYSGLDLFAEGKYADAAAAYRRALELDPAFTDSLHALSKALLELKDYEGAIAAARRINELDPDDILAHTSLSILYQHRGMIKEAEDEANKARILGWKQQLREQKRQAGG